ncbi:EboA domain-containing protein [Pedobacter sp. L105]|uniref:EboA domain-containing protein n=1 Tax=Pedobacter sp. L105 TaxID=1641871 RepID=UPI00131E6DF5|nr:EboA domain-containing protein [Pedobacter sp. L105]
MFHYDVEKLKASIEEIIIENITDEARIWLQMKVASHQTSVDFNGTFAAIPRRTGKQAIILNNDQQKTLSACRNNFSIENWTVDRLTRIWLLLELNSTDQDQYHRSIESLFMAAEMNELVALYSSLPLLAYPEIWAQRCSEGIRSNIGNVLEAIMYNNPYPSENLSQPAWNQLVLKAFFTEKQLDQIIGLYDRANEELAYTLVDYAKEREAAGREVNPELWLLVDKFIDIPK